MANHSRRWVGMGWLKRSVVLLWCFGLGCRAPHEPALSVYAASSLTDAFRELATAFEQREGQSVNVVLAGSQVLKMQIEQGAPADIFASADQVHMASLAAQGLLERAVPFLQNELVLVVSEQQAGQIRALADLPMARRLVLGTDHAPIGRYSRAVLRAADGVVGDRFEQRVMERVVSRESNARLVRAKVLMGEADAAFLYRTDVIGVDGLTVIAIPLALQPRILYSIGQVRSGDSRRASAWQAFATGSDAHAVYERYGFQGIR